MKQWFIAVLVGSYAGIVFAANTAEITPAGANPANIMNALDQALPSIQKQPAKRNVDVESNPQLITHEDKIKTRFVLKHVIIVGAKHPLPPNVAAIYQTAIGKRISFKELQMMVDKMEATYRNNGDILTQVILPPQRIRSKVGAVKIQIVEGQVEKVSFTGDNPKGARNQLQRYAAQIMAEDPITFQTLDRFLNLANQLPGIDVAAALAPNKTVPGGADVVINVNQKPYSAFINFNNRGTEFIGPDILSAGGSIYDILGADAFSISTATSTNNPQQLKYGNVSYDVVIGNYATEINPSLSVTKTRPGGDLSDLDMRGNSTQWSLAVNQPLKVSTTQNLTLQTNLSNTESDNNIDGNQELFHDNITTFSLGLDYKGLFLKTYNDINLSATTGLPILGAPASESDPSIANGKNKFIRFNLLTSSTYYFTPRTSIAVGTQVQQTSQTMLASQQIGYGGQAFGQAFAPYVIAGDNGYMGSVALRYDLPVVQGIQLLQPEIFYDAGYVTLNHAPTGTASNASAQSLGVGLLVQALKNCQLDFTLAKPLDITNTDGVGKSWAGFVNVTVLF